MALKLSILDPLRGSRGITEEVSSLSLANRAHSTHPSQPPFSNSTFEGWRQTQINSIEFITTLEFFNKQREGDIVPMKLSSRDGVRQIIFHFFALIYKHTCSLFFSFHCLFPRFIEEMVQVLYYKQVPSIFLGEVDPFFFLSKN